LCGKTAGGFCKGEAYNDAGLNLAALSIPKGERNGEYRASLNIGGVLPTRLQRRIRPLAFTTECENVEVPTTSAIYKHCVALVI
jgi:hypothetical protein